MSATTATTSSPLAAHEPGIGSFDHAATTASYRHGDQIGSTRAITGPGSAGVPPASIQGRIVYTAFGERVWSDGAVGTRYQCAGSWGYQSDLYEDAGANALPSSLFPAPCIHVGHRWYDPATGRFLQRDPIGIAGAINVYGYADFSPLFIVDPFGLQPYSQYQELRAHGEGRVTAATVTCAVWVSGLIGLENLYDAAEGKDRFGTPLSRRDRIKRGATGGLQMGLTGGGIWLRCVRMPKPPPTIPPDLHRERIPPANPNIPFPKQPANPKPPLKKAA